MKKIGLYLIMLGVVFAMPACSDDDDDDLLTTYTITAVPNDDTYGSAEGGGEYEEGENVVLTATAEEDYVFSSWQEDGEVVHEMPEYEFTATEDRDLVAVFQPEDAVGFSIDITGDWEHSSDGIAFFTEMTYEETGQDIFALGLAGINLGFLKGGDQPGTGTMNIGEVNMEDISEDDYTFSEEQFVASMVNVTGMSGQIFFSDEGTIEITTSTELAFEGTFDFTATGMDLANPTEELEVQMQGSFTALPGDIEIPDIPE